MRDSYLVFGQPRIEEAEIEEVVASLRAAWLGTGPKVAAFERLVAEYKGASHAVAVNSCTAGLHLACVALGLKPGDEVIVPAMTFCATVNAVIHAGATPVIADVDPVTFNLSPNEVERRITARTKALMPVHFAGRACDMDPLLTIAREHDLRIVEDCAHAIETEYHGQRVGTLGDCGILSFYATKNVVTGEGGMVLTNDSSLAARLKVMALHGMSQDAWKRFSDDGYKHYDVVEVGFKYNMMDLQAAIGMHQIRRVEEYLAATPRRLAAIRRGVRGSAREPAGDTGPVLAPWASSLHATGRQRPSARRSRPLHWRASPPQDRHRRPLPIDPHLFRVPAAVRLETRRLPRGERDRPEHRLAAAVGQAVG